MNRSDSGHSLMKDDWFKRVGFAGLLGFVAALQFSIAVANIFFSLALLMSLLRLMTGRTKFAAPAFFIPLAAYGAITLVSAAFSSDPRVGFIDSKQLVLFLIVPMVYDLARGSTAPFVVQVIISVGAISAAVGVVQYGVLQYDNLGRRAQGSLGHYMTYSGLLMLVTCAACARILFTRDRIWPLLMMPALIAALAASFSRSAWVGTCAGVAFLMLLKDFRLMAVAPVIAALFLALAPPQITERFYSMFDPHDATRLDRVAMLHVGERMVAAHPRVAFSGCLRVVVHHRDARGRTVRIQFRRFGIPHAVPRFHDPAVRASLRCPRLSSLSGRSMAREATRSYGSSRVYRL